MGLLSGVVCPLAWRRRAPFPRFPVRRTFTCIHLPMNHLHSLAFWAIALIFLLTSSDWKPSTTSTKPLEYTPAVPGPVVNFLWPWEVIEHGPRGAPPHASAAGATSGLTEGHVRRVPMTIKSKPLFLGLLGRALGIQKV